jgi:hypothetical protein
MGAIRINTYFRNSSGSFATLAAIRRAGDAAQMRQLNYSGCCKFVTTQSALRSVVASSRDVELASTKDYPQGPN